MRGAAGCSFLHCPAVRALLLPVLRSCTSAGAVERLWRRLLVAAGAATSRVFSVDLPFSSHLAKCTPGLCLPTACDTCSLVLGDLGCPTSSCPPGRSPRRRGRSHRARHSCALVCGILDCITLVCPSLVQFMAVLRVACARSVSCVHFHPYISTLQRYD